MPAYFNDYGSGCLGTLGVLAALLRRAEEGGGWRVRVSLAKTAMLGTRFADNREAAVPIVDSELDRYLVDQDADTLAATSASRPVDDDLEAFVARRRHVDSG